MAFTLIIKGNMHDATAACAAKGVELLDTPIKHPRYDETTCVVADTTSWEKLSRWFCEACGKYVFPPGSLLWYGPRVMPSTTDIR